MSEKLIPILLAQLVVCHVSVRATAQPSFMGLGGVGGSPVVSVVLDVSGNGQVAVGWLPREASGGEGFHWTAQGGFTRLGDLPGGLYESHGYGASYDGSIVVGDSFVGFGDYNGFAWTNFLGGVMVDLGGNGAVKVSDDGSVIVGNWNEGAAKLENGVLTYLVPVSAEYTASGVAGLSADGSVASGRLRKDGNFQAYRWENGIVQELGHLAGGFAYSEAFSISPDGQVVVGVSDGTEGRQAFRWTEAEGMVGLGDLPGGNFYSIAEDANWDGSIVVGSSTANDQHFGNAFIWDAVHGMRDLHDVLEDVYGLSLNGWHLDVAKGISYDGMTIVGNGRNPAGRQEGWIVRLPEPSTAGLMVFSLAMATRRRRVKAVAV